MRELVEAQSSESEVVTMIVAAMDNLVTASVALQESLAELQAWAAALQPGSQELREPVAFGENRVSGQLALREQARQLEHHAGHLRGQASDLCGRARSLSAHAANLMRDSQRIVGAKEQSRLFRARHDRTDGPSAASDMRPAGTPDSG
jgi:chromosome segregation ATPase